jgi:hypothetical protein
MHLRAFEITRASWVNVYHDRAQHASVFDDILVGRARPGRAPVAGINL